MRRASDTVQKVACCALLLAIPICRPPAAAALNPGDLLVADWGVWNQPGDGRILAIDPQTGAQSVVSIGGLLHDPSDLVVHPDGYLYVTDRGPKQISPYLDGTVVRIDPSDGSQEIVAGGFLNNYGIAVEPGGTLLVSDLSWHSIFRVDPVSGSRVLFSIMLAPTKMVFAENGDLFVAQAGTIGKLSKLDAATGAWSIVADGMSNLVGLAIDQAGDLIVTQVNPAVLTRINPQTGERTVLATGGHIWGGYDLAMTPGGDLFMTDLNAASIIQIDPVTWTMTVLSSAGDLMRPFGLALVPSTDSDGDGIDDEVDLDPLNQSTEFSDVSLGGVTSGRILSLDAGITVRILDAVDPQGGVKVLVAGPAAAEAKIKIDGSTGTYKLTPGEYVLTSGSVTLESVDGSAEVEFVIDGAEVRVGVAGTVVFHELIVGGELRELEVAAVDGVVTVNGLSVNPGESLVLPVLYPIDIRPGSDSNPINPTSRGVVPVAVLGSDTVDVWSIDATTLEFGAGRAAPVHRGGGYLEDVNGDGFMDLVSHYRTAQAAIEGSEACLRGTTVDGIPMVGCDLVTLVGG